MKTNKGRNVIKWVKEHRREAIFTGLDLLTVAICYKHKSEIKEACIWFKDNCKASIFESSSLDMSTVVESVTETTSQVTAPDLISHKIAAAPVEVAKHIRNLPEGWNASPEKLRTAVENGFALLNNQTWVDEYVKNTSSI